MNGFIIKRKKTAVLLVIISLIFAGCAAQTTKTTGSYYENRRFVPRIHVEDNAFGVMSAEYQGCSYDQRSDGYWCPVNR